MSADGADDEIVASGDALRTVAGWLGVADAAAVLEGEGLNPEYEQGRTQGLGLGAKFLPHHKAVALTSGVEHRLSSKLKRTAERQAAAGGGGSGYQHHHQHPGASKHAALLQHGRHHAGGRGQGLAAAGQQQQQQQAAEGGEDDDSEEEGRGGAFSKGKGKGAARPATYSRSDLLLAGPTGQGKKRKRKGGQGGSGAAGS